MFSAARWWPAIGLLFSFTSAIFVVQVRASKLSSSVYNHPQLFAYMFTRSPPCIDGRLHLWRLLQALLLLLMPLTTWLLFLFANVLSLSSGCEYFRLPSCSIELPCFQFTSSLTPPVPSDNAGLSPSSSQMSQNSLPFPSVNMLSGNIISTSSFVFFMDLIFCLFYFY